MVIACSDSRVEPAIIFDARPGEMFVVRNIAALAPPYETTPGHHGVSAALEFAVTQLEVEEVVVLGHGSCGGCAAALTGQFDRAEHGAGRFIANWVKMLANLRTFPWVVEREAAGKLALHGCHFSINDGKLYVLDEAEGIFRPA
jgi:carbonic anhydrase